jgi:hypothetical protein
MRFSPEVDRGSLHASQAIKRLLTTQITLRNHHRLRIVRIAMRSSPRSVQVRASPGCTSQHFRERHRTLTRTFR